MVRSRISPSAVAARPRTRGSTVLQRLHERLRSTRVTKVAERRDGVKPDVGLFVLQRLNQSRHRPWTLHACERDCRLAADTGIAVLEREIKPSTARSFGLFCAVTPVIRICGVSAFGRPGDHSSDGLTTANPTPRQMAVDRLSVRKKTASGLMNPSLLLEN